jgi:hypothetical protein
LRLIVQPCDENDDDDYYFCPFPINGALVEWNWQGKTEVLGEKTCPSDTLSITNPTWTEPGSNPGLRSGRPAVNRLSHGMPGIVPYSHTNPLSLWHVALTRWVECKPIYTSVCRQAYYTSQISIHPHCLQVTDF